MANNCAGCRISISGDFIKCTACDCNYDLLCANISPDTFANLSIEHKNTWTCVECYSKLPKGNNTHTPVRAPGPSNVGSSADDTLNQDKNNVTVGRGAQRKKTSGNMPAQTSLNEFKEEIKSMMKNFMMMQEKDLKNVKKELREISPTLLEIRRSNTSIESSIALLTQQNEELRSKIIQLEINSKCDQEHIAILEEKLENIQRDNRKANIEIKNVPKSDHESKESLVDMVLHLSKAVECNISKSDIKDIYRVRSKREGINSTPIVVEMTSTLTKTNILKMCKSHNTSKQEKLRAKHLGFTCNTDTPIYVSEQLTARGARLHFLARDLKLSKSYKHCWTSYGRIYVRHKDNSKIIQIESEQQVQRLMQENVEMFCFWYYY